MGQIETVYYLKGGQISSQTLSDNVRLFGTSRVGRQLGDKVRLFSTPRVVRQLRKHDGTKWDCLVSLWLSDNSTNTMGQNETVWYLNGCQITSQTRWDKARLFCTSMVVRQLHKHDGTKWDCLVHQWLSDNFTNTKGQSETLVPLGLSDNFTNTMGQTENV